MLENWQFKEQGILLKVLSNDPNTFLKNTWVSRKDKDRNIILVTVILFYLSAECSAERESLFSSEITVGLICKQTLSAADYAVPLLFASWKTLWLEEKAALYLLITVKTSQLHTGDQIWSCSFALTLRIGRRVTPAGAQAGPSMAQHFGVSLCRLAIFSLLLIRINLIALLGLYWIQNYAVSFHRGAFFPSTMVYETSKSTGHSLTADSFLIHKNKQIARHMSELNSIYSVGTCKCNNTL